MSVVCRTTSDTILLTGDFNVHFETSDKSSKDLQDLLLDYGLQQSVNDPTHIHSHTLDLVFSNPYNLPINTKVNSQLSVSSSPYIKFDHFPVLFEIPFAQDPPSIHHEKKIYKSYRNIKKINIEEFRYCLDAQLTSAQLQLSLTDSFSTALELYNHCLASVLDELAPEKKCPIKSDTEVAPKWIDQEYIAERQARRKFEKEWKRLGTSDSHQKYIQQRDRCILLANSKQRLFYSNLIASSDNQSVLFKTVSELWNKKNTKSLPANNGNMTTLANGFNDFFSEKIQSIRNQLTLSSNYLLNLNLVMVIHLYRSTHFNHPVEKSYVK